MRSLSLAILALFSLWSLNASTTLGVLKTVRAESPVPGIFEQLEQVEALKKSLPANLQKMDSGLMKKMSTPLQERRLEIPQSSDPNRQTVAPGIRAQEPSVSTKAYVSLRSPSTVEAIKRQGIRILHIAGDKRQLSVEAQDHELLWLSNQVGVTSIRQVIPPLVNRGSRVTEGDIIHRANIIRGLFGQQGDGIKIGVISDGVFGIENAQSTGDLGNVTILSNRQGGSEGTAMLEIIHDMAPRAELFFHDHGGDFIGFNAGIDLLVSAGVDIIVDDISWIAAPFFEDGNGTVAQHVRRTLENRNILYVSSAGNQGQSHHQSRFFNRGDACHDFSAGNGESLSISIPAQAQLIAILQWDEAFGNAQSDYDLFLSTNQLGDLAISSGNNAVSGDPLEFFFFPNNGSGTITANLDICRQSGNGAQEVELYLYDIGQRGSFIDQRFISARDAIFGHAAVEEVISVGAVPATSPDSLEPFSSQGPVTTLRRGVISKPDLVAVDGVSVTGSGNFPSTFFGTSASAPHVAAIAGLIWAEHRELLPTHVKELIYSNASDLGAHGYDLAFGFGLADALESFQAIPRLEVTIEDEDGQLDQSELSSGLIISISTSNVEDGQLLSCTLSTQSLRRNLAGSVRSNQAIITTEPLLLKQGDIVRVACGSSTRAGIPTRNTSDQSIVIESSFEPTPAPTPLPTPDPEPTPGPPEPAPVPDPLPGPLDPPEDPFPPPPEPPRPPRVSASPEILSIAGDGLINSSEKTAVEIQAVAAIGSKVTFLLTDGTNTVQQQITNETKQFTITLDTTSAVPFALQDGVITLRAFAEEEGALVSDSIELLTSLRSGYPAAITEFVVAGDNVISAEETGATQITGSAISADFVSVTLSDGVRNQSYLVESGSNSFVLTVDTSIFNDGALSLYIQAIDNHGNGSQVLRRVAYKRTET